MDSENIPIIIDGPNYINRILDLEIDKDIISDQLSFEEFRIFVKRRLVENNINCELPIVEFVCSKKLFGSNNKKFSQNERDRLLDTIMLEKGVHIEEVILPGSSEKGVDNTVTTKIDTFSKSFEYIILISNDRDFVPILKKMREQGTLIILISPAENIPKELINEAHLTINLFQDYHCLFKYNYNEYQLYDEFTKEMYKSIIANGDDRINNQLRVETGGSVYLSKVVGNRDIIGLQFRFETFHAYNEYVGPRSASKSEYIEEEFKELMLAWEHKNEVDSYIDIPVRSMIKK